jgi:hypothetical protein
MPGDPQECRQLARDCLRLAEEATSDPARQDYMALAYTWTELANVWCRIQCRAAPTATAYQAKGRIAPKGRAGLPKIRGARRSERPQPV